MQRVAIDEASTAVREFIRGLPLDSNGIALELDGKVVCEILPPSELTDESRAALIARGRQLARRARDRNRVVSAKTLEREIEDAVAAVRQRRPK